MNIPSIRALMTIDKVTLADATRARAVLEMSAIEDVTAASQEAADYVRSCYNRPPLQVVKLTALDAILGTFGVEYIPAGRGSRSPSVEYLNTGDSYALTLMWTRGRYVVKSLGDIVERGNYE